MEKSRVRGISAIVGTVVGAGTLGIPYAISQVGFSIGLVYLVAIGLMSLLVMLYATELVLRTKKVKQMPGLAEKYLGKWGKGLMMIFQVLGIYGALIAYLTGIGTSFSGLIGGSSTAYSAAFFVIALFLVFNGLKAIEKVEPLLSSMKLIILVLLCIAIAPKIDFSNFRGVELSQWFIPYSVFMFAYAGYTVIPNIERIMEKNKKDMAKVIFFGVFLCFFIYLVFSGVFVGSFGKGVGQIATQGLDGILGIFAKIATIFLLATPFFILSWVLKDTFMDDYGANPSVATLMACAVPFALMLLVKPTFIQMLEISGGYAVSATYIFIALMVKRARETGDDTPEFVVPFGDLPLYLVMLMGLLGIVYTTVGLL